MNQDDPNEMLSNNFQNSTLPNADDTQEIVSFSNDADGVVAGLPEVISLPKEYKSQYMASTQDDILNFLARPATLTSGDFTAVDTGILYTGLLLRDVVSIGMFKAKLRGFATIKATLKCRLVVNGNPFQAGRYILAYVPTLSGPTAPCVSGVVRARKFSLTHITQLPHVQLDIASQSEAVLQIPWMHTHLAESLDFNILHAQMGELILTTYSPLVAPTGTATASYRVYVSLHDVELGGPCLTPQSNWTPRSRLRTGKRGKTLSTTNPVETEQQEANLGPITGALTKVTAAANLLSQVPLLSAIAAPVAWATNIAAGVASIFGWSAPLDLSEVTRAVQTLQPFANNVDMPDQSMPLSLYARNLLEVVPGIAATDVDEMSFDFLKTIPAYFSTLTWSTASPVGTPIVSYGIGPSTFVRTSGVFSFGAPFVFLQNYFSLWRGSIRIKLIFVKTQFHSGRLQIVFVPSMPNAGQTPATEAVAAYMLKEIVDIRSGTEYEITVPYMSSTPWKGASEVMGVLHFYVLNPLTAPSSVSSTVKVLVEVSAGPDYEFAVPRAFTAVLNAPVSVIPQSSWSPPPKTTQIKSGEIGNSINFDDSNYSSRYCIGEKVLSVNALLKSNSFVNTSIATAGVRLIPHSIQFEVDGLNGVSFTPGPYDFLTSMYAMVRGSIRIRAIKLAGDSGFFMSSLENFTSGSNVGISSGRSMASMINFASGGLLAAQSGSFRGGSEVQVPFYGRTHSFATSQLCTNSVNAILYDNSNVPCTRLEISSTLASSWTIGKSVGDDFQLSLFVCTPIWYPRTPT